MDKTWIKLYRKINSNAIITDANALQAFIWILTNVNRDTGEINFGRFQLAKILKTNPNTLRHAILRLVEKYKVIEKSDATSDATSRRHKGYTTIRVLNWAKYQAPEISTPQLDAPVTPLNKKENIYIKDNTKRYSNDLYKEKKNIFIFKGKDYSLSEYHVYQIANPSSTLPPVKRGSKMQEYVEALSSEQAWEFAEMYGGRS